MSRKITEELKTVIWSMFLTSQKQYLWSGVKMKIDQFFILRVLPPTSPCKGYTWWRNSVTQNCFFLFVGIFCIIPHSNIYKGSWVSSDGLPCKWIDHMAVTTDWYIQHLGEEWTSKYIKGKKHRRHRNSTVKNWRAQTLETISEKLNEQLHGMHGHWGLMKNGIR